MYMCLYVCVRTRVCYKYIHRYICMYTHTHTHTHIHMFIHIYICVCVSLLLVHKVRTLLTGDNIDSMKFGFHNCKKSYNLPYTNLGQRIRHYNIAFYLSMCSYVYLCANLDPSLLILRFLQSEWQDNVVNYTIIDISNLCIHRYSDSNSVIHAYLTVQYTCTIQFNPKSVHNIT